MQNQFNGNSKPEGKRNGVPATEIADTLESLFAYLESSQQDKPDFLKALLKEADGWRRQVSSLRGAGKDALDSFFGQPSPGEIRGILAAKGITEDNTGDREYRQKYNDISAGMKTGSGCYLQGEVVPTLSEYRALLKFDAYRERLGGDDNGPAGTLLKRLDAFDGGFGRKHMAGGGISSDIREYINKHPRHPAEAYVEPAGVYVDYLNAFDHTYSSYVSWKPSDDMQQAVAIVSCGTWASPEDRNMAIAQEKVKFEVALGRGGIQAGVKVVLGKTYADDALVMTMSMGDYTGRFIPIKCGKIEIDLSLPGRGDEADLRTVKFYSGYEPGKQAFFDVDELLVSAPVMKALDADFPEERLESAAEALRFGREMNKLIETPEQIPIAPGQKGDFIRLKIAAQQWDVPVYEFEGAYYGSCDMANKMNGVLHEVEAAVNGRPRKNNMGSQAAKVPDDEFFEHDGDMYIPRGEKFSQIALHMKYKHGVDYTCVIDDDKAKEKAGGKDKYVIRTGKLDPAARDIALADLNGRLKQDWRPNDIHAATVLRKKMKVGKPLSLAQKP